MNRREWILNSEQPVTEIVKIYPCLTKLTYVSITIPFAHLNTYKQISQEMDMICCTEGTASLFDEKIFYDIGILQINTLSNQGTKGDSEIYRSKFIR